MMKYLSYITLLLCILAAPFKQQAQSLDGNWTFYPAMRPSIISAMAETESRLYILSTLNLFALEKGTDKPLTHIGALQGLSGTLVKRIAPYGNNAIVAITSEGYINVINDDGTIDVISGLANIHLLESTTVNTVDICGSRLLATADYGTALVDLQKGVVEDFGVYSRTQATGTIQGTLTGTALAGDIIVAQNSSALWGADCSNASIASASAFKQVASGQATQKRLGVARGVYLDLGTDGKVYRSRLADDLSAVTAGDTGITSATDIWTAGGRYFCLGTYGGTAGIFELPAPEAEDVPTPVRVAAIPAAAGTVSVASYYPGASEMWLATPAGVGAYDVTTGELTLDATSARMVGNVTAPLSISLMETSRDGKRLYLASRGSGDINHPYRGAVYYPDLQDARPDIVNTVRANGCGTGVGFLNSGFVSVMEDGTLTDRTLYGATSCHGDLTTNNYGFYTRNTNQYARVIWGFDGMTENPNKPGQYWATGACEGIYRIDGTTQTGIFNGYASGALGTALNNAPINAGWGQQVFDVRFDREGNLWAFTSQYSNYRYPNLIMLPKDKVDSDYTTITRSDWVQIPDPASHATGDFLFNTRLLMTRNTPDGRELICISPRYWKPYLDIIDRKSSGASIENDVRYHISWFEDQYGTEFQSWTGMRLKEDNEGRLWILDENVMFVLEDFTQLDGDATKTKLKVRRIYAESDEGSPVPSDLLAGFAPSDITQAKDGTLWVSTVTDGLYHLDRYGTTILHHLTTANSQLPTNVVAAVQADIDPDRATDIIYVGTNIGLASFEPGMPQAASNLDDVTLSPERVHSGYNGWFVIDGLTTSCPVKITAADGSTVLSAHSEGGRLLWNGLDAQGRRVLPGAYTVHVGATPRLAGRFIVTQ